MILRVLAFCAAAMAALPGQADNRLETFVGGQTHFGYITGWISITANTSHGIECGHDIFGYVRCWDVYPSGAIVTLEAHAQTQVDYDGGVQCGSASAYCHYKFTGWSGDCSGVVKAEMPPEAAVLWVWPETG